MEDYQSENDSIHLNHVKPYSAVVPGRGNVWIPQPESSPSLWGRAVFSS